VLLDTAHGGRAGGSGRTFPWFVAATVAAEFTVMVAGGLDGENVGEDAREVQPFGVDASSRLESAPGLKDKEKVRRFVTAVRTHDADSRRDAMTPAGTASVPDAAGHFGAYGGRFVPETLIHALDQLEAEFARAQADPDFRAELAVTLRDFAGRPTPLIEARRFSERAGCRVFLKREDLLHTGAHKINTPSAMPAHAAHGQAARHRRDRGRPARRRHGRRRRALRPRLHRLHGRPRTRAASTSTSSA